MVIKYDEKARFSAWQILPFDRRKHSHPLYAEFHNHVEYMARRRAREVHASCASRGEYCEKKHNSKLKLNQNIKSKFQKNTSTSKFAYRESTKADFLQIHKNISFALNVTLVYIFSRFGSPSFFSPVSFCTSPHNLQIWQNVGIIFCIKFKNVYRFTKIRKLLNFLSSEIHHFGGFFVSFVYELGSSENIPEVLFPPRRWWKYCSHLFVLAAHSRKAMRIKLRVIKRARWN